MHAGRLLSGFLGDSATDQSSLDRSHLAPEYFTKDSLNGCFKERLTSLHELLYQFWRSGQENLGSPEWLDRQAEAVANQRNAGRDNGNTGRYGPWPVYTEGPAGEEVARVPISR